MIRSTLFAGAAVALLAVAAGQTFASEVEGFYLEARTCQVYTGPCFANSEFGLAGKNAMMAWSIERGDRNGVDLSGLNVVMVISSSETLAHEGIADGGQVKSAILVDERANSEQRAALEQFARERAGKAGQAVARVDAAPIDMTLDTTKLVGKLKAGKYAELVTRKARPGDCICSNEIAYYPPLTSLASFAPGVVVQGSYSGRGPGGHWSIPGSRSAYVGLFSY